MNEIDMYQWTINKIEQTFDFLSTEMCETYKIY